MANHHRCLMSRMYDVGLAMHACQQGDLVALQQFLDDGGDVNATYAGNTLVQHAVIFGQCEALHWLVEHKANITETSSPSLSLAAHAAAFSNVALLRALAAYKADLNAGVRTNKAVVLAAVNGSVGTIRVLAELKAALDEGLYSACAHGNADAVRALLELKAQLDQPTFRLCPLLFTPVRIGCTDVVCSLLESGADVNAPAATGEYSLHDAVASGRASTVAVLLTYNADLSVISQQEPLAPSISDYWHAASREDDLVHAMLWGASRQEVVARVLSRDPGFSREHRIHQEARMLTFLRGVWDVHQLKAPPSPLVRCVRNGLFDVQLMRNVGRFLRYSAESYACIRHSWCHGKGGCAGRCRIGDRARA